MIKGLDNLPLSRVQFLSEFNSPHKNHMKISNHKFPPDFFKLKATKKLYLSSPLVRNQPQTHQEGRSNGKVTPLKMQIQKRQNLTARNSRQNDQDLIMGVISTTRQMKKIIRKHSLQIKKQNKDKKFKLDLELPPLILRKGVATAN